MATAERCSRRMRKGRPGLCRDAFCEERGATAGGEACFKPAACAMAARNAGQIRRYPGLSWAATGRRGACADRLALLQTKACAKAQAGDGWGRGLTVYGLVLLRHSICAAPLCWRRPQHGHRGSARIRERARRMRSVVIDFGICRCDRNGGAAGAVTAGNGRLRASPGCSNS